MGPFGTCIPQRAETANRLGSDLQREKAYGRGQTELEAFHLSRSQVVLDAGAQILAFETVADLVEAQAICNVLRTL